MSKCRVLGVSGGDYDRIRLRHRANRPVFKCTPSVFECTLKCPHRAMPRSTAVIARSAHGCRPTHGRSNKIAARQPPKPAGTAHVGWLDKIRFEVLYAASPWMAMLEQCWDRVVRLG